MFVFGRNTTAEYGRLSELAGALTKLPEESWQAVGWNLLYDHRVSESRAMDFYEREKPTTPRELERALRNYHWDVVCKLPAESYRSETLNRNNFVDRNKLRSDSTFAHVLNLSAWAKVLYLENQLDIFTSRPRSAADDDTFLSSFLSSVNSAWDRRPIWLARWDEFERFIERGRPSTWNTSIGIWRQSGDWQIVLRLRLAELPGLVRPTQLDSGFCQYHFPSPPLPLPHDGGFVMELREAPWRRVLMPEWIHGPIELSTDHWNYGGRRIAAVDETADATMVYRSQHRQRLFIKYPGKWIPEK